MGSVYLGEVVSPCLFTIHLVWCDQASPDSWLPEYVAMSLEFVTDPFICVSKQTLAGYLSRIFWCPTGPFVFLAPSGDLLAICQLLSDLGLFGIPDCPPSWNISSR